MGKHLSPKTITCHLQTIRLFFDYLIDDEGIEMANPITRASIRLQKPLPRHVQYNQVGKFLAVITELRDRAMVMLMLRCGLRVEEVSRLTVGAVEFAWNRLFIANADLSTIQDLLGHTHITTTQRYCRVSNVKVQRDKTTTPWSWSCSGARQKAAYTVKNHLDRKTWLIEHRHIHTRDEKMNTRKIRCN
jgi:site-specific recombinase XerD